MRKPSMALGEIRQLHGGSKIQHPDLKRILSAQPQDTHAIKIPSHVNGRARQMRHPTSQTRHASRPRPFIVEHECFI